MFKRVVLSVVLAAVLVSLLAPTAFAGCPGGNCNGGNGGSQGWVQKVKGWFNRNQTPAQRQFFSSGRAVQRLVGATACGGTW